MAYYYKNGTGIDQWAYIYVQLQVTRTDYPTYSRFSVKSVAVSDTGTSSFIRGQVTTNQGGTSWTAATGWKSVSYNGTTTLATASFDVARGASDKTAHIGAYAEGGGTGIYSGGTDYAWLDVTVPKVLAPNAPTGCTATYVSDSQATVSWTNGTADTDHPRDATLVERRDGSNEWAQVASVSGTASSYTDNGISPNGQYQYRVRAKNAAGYSAYSTSGSIYTTPAAPASVTLDKTAATTVQVNATGTWVYAVTYDVELTYDSGATWSTVATSTSLPYSATVSGGTVQFRVRATRGALASAWTLSASLVTITPPLAPTIVQAPANPSAYGEQAEVAWTPNHPDGSSQESAEIKVTNPGGTSTTYTVTTATSYQLTPNATGTWTAQVRTKGLDPSYGEWSQAVSWAVANPPAVVITSPATDGTDINALPLTVSWTVTDSTGVSTQRIIIEGETEILNRTLAGDVRTLSLTASDVDLVDGETYTIRIRVMGGSGLVTEQTRIFDVSWLAPTAPLLQITEGEGESASIDVVSTTYPESGTVLEASSAMMESLTIDGASVQDGTPTPSSPVAIESVQSPNLLVDSTVYNLATNSSGVIITNSSYKSVRCKIPESASTQEFTLSRPIAEGNRFQIFYTLEEPAVGGQTYEVVTGNRPMLAVTFSVPAGASWLLVFLENGSSTIDPNNICITRKGAPLFVGYGSVNVVAEGKNMFDPKYLLQASGWSVADGVYTGTSSSLYNSFSISNSFYPIVREFVAGSRYTISLQYVSADTTKRTIVAFRYTDGTFVTNGLYGSGSYSFTTEAGKTLDSVAFSYSDSTTISLSNIQLEIGSTATAYEPYSSTTTTIPVTLRSVPDGTHDEWISGETEDTLVQRVSVQVFDGSETWTQNSVTANNIRMVTTVSDLASVTNADTSKRVMSSMLSPATAATAIGSDNANVIAAISNHRIFVSVPVATYPNVAAWTSALASTPMTVIYKLETPVTTTLAHVNLPYVDGSAWVDAEVTPNIEATFRPVDFPDQPAADSVDVIRVNADGSTWTVASGLSVGDTAIDPLPPLGVPVEYRAVGTAPSGATSSGSYTETIGGREWVLNFGNAAQEHVALMFNPRSTLSLDQGGESYHFADGGAGNGLPVWYGITDRDMSGSLRFDTNHYGDTDVVIDLCNRYPVAWLRDPYGHRWRAHVKPSLSHDYGGAWPVTFSWDAVRFKEAW